FTTRGSSATAALCFRKLPDRRNTVPEDASRLADRGSNHFISNHYQTQIGPVKIRFNQHVRTELTSDFDRRLYSFRLSEADCNALALLSPRRLYHKAAVPFEKRLSGCRSVFLQLFRHLQTGAFHDAPCHPFVVADRQGDRRCQVGKGFPAP